MAKKKSQSSVVAGLIERGYTVEEANKIAAHIGKRKYGKPRFDSMALAGRKKLYASRKRK